MPRHVPKNLLAIAFWYGRLSEVPGTKDASAIHYARSSLVHLDLWFRQWEHVA
jgi:hypothetical protein